MTEETPALSPQELALAEAWAGDMKDMSEHAIASKMVQMMIICEGNLNKISHTFEIMLTAHTLARKSP